MLSRRARLALTILVLSLAASPAALAGEPPEKATPLSAWELKILYGGKTWLWPTGGGYLAEDRTFSAWVDDGGSITTAKGKWLVTDRGRLCFEAVWGAGKTASTLTNCFLHVQADGTIYQRNADNGEWYVFKHAAPEPTDEFQKLVAGNQTPATASQ